MKTHIILALLGIVAFREVGLGMRMEEIGPAKSSVEQPGWPKGLGAVVGHPARVYTVWYTGGETFYFQATPDELNDLLELFGKARMRDHEVWIEPGTNTVKSFGGEVYDYNVSLEVRSGFALLAAREKDTSETLEPRLTIYAGEGQSLLKRLKLPDNAIVRCEIEGAEVKGKATKPVRKAWFGCVQFEDGSPGVDLQHGLNTRITFWEKGVAEGIELAYVSHEGFFQVVFSNSEIAALEKGESWLTVKLGNYAAKVTREDIRYPVGLLAREREEAKSLKIGRPRYYYGRVLFEDGLPAVLNPAPWPGAEISVSLSYVGSAKLDAEGYFQVSLEPEQLAELKSRKPSRNIYVPDEIRSQSTAREVFPAELLSQDKATAGVVKIAKPVFKPRYDPAKAPSRIGQALPPLRGFGIEGSPDEVSGRMMLVCFFDLHERPSRHAVAELVKQAEELKSKGVYVAVVQVHAVGKPALHGFAQTNQITFPVGMIEAEEEKTKFNWGLKSQPWLILTDKEHIVRAEGFPPSDLNERISALR